MPQFGYQLQFGSPDRKVEKVVAGEAKIRKWLTGMYGGKPKSGKVLMNPKKGIDLSLVEEDEFEMTPLLNQEVGVSIVICHSISVLANDLQELDYYVAQFTKSGLEGPCNWYRTREVNFEDEKALPADQRQGVKQPSLFVFAEKDSVLSEDLTKGMDKAIPNLTKGRVPATHWALWHTPVETNDIIKRWFEGVVLGGKSKL